MVSPTMTSPAVMMPLPSPSSQPRIGRSHCPPSGKPGHEPRLGPDRLRAFAQGKQLVAVDRAGEGHGPAEAVEIHELRRES